MALSGLDIYKQLPKTNCRECGFPTCLAFAMQLAAKKVSLDKCPHVSSEAKRALESASMPPIKLVTIGSDEARLEVGNETVLFRHEETFYHPTGIGFLLEDNLTSDALKERLNKINKLQFERVGQQIKVDLVALKHSGGDGQRFVDFVKEVLENTSLALIIMSDDLKALKGALEISKKRHPLIYAACKDNLENMVALAKEYNLPLVVKAENLQDLSELSSKAGSLGLKDIILEVASCNLQQEISDLTQIRRLALKKNLRALGYPTISFTTSDDAYEEVMEAATLITKYSSIVIMKGTENWQVLPLLTLRQNIFTDPQKPLQVEPKVYEIGNVNDKSPVMVTTNFSLTYYTVEAEVESSRIPAYIISSYAEGVSVLTAWPAEKFTAETIAKSLEDCKIKEKVSHKELIIPGYVAVLSGKLEEASGWKVRVGPREASGLPSFLKALKE